MKKLFTKHLFRAFTLLTLMLTTTLVANAAFHIRGGFDVEANNQWGLGVTMTETSTGVFEGDVTATTGFNFKLYNDYDNKWWGSNAGSIAVSDANGAITMIEDGGGDTYVPCAGTLHFTFTSSNHKLTITADPRPVSVGSATNGTITVNPTTASPNETVTITLTPATGYYAENVDNNITVQVTGPVGGGNKAPEIGQNLIVTGDAIALPDAPGEYTFTMPAYPFSALVSAKFLPCIELTASMFNPLGYYSWTGGEIKPVPNPAEGSGLTANDYEVTGYTNNINEGTATVTVQGKGKYTGTVTLNFDIVKQLHQLIYIQPTGGTISGPNSARYTDEITLTATPNEGYQLDHFVIPDNTAWLDAAVIRAVFDPDNDKILRSEGIISPSARSNNEFIPADPGADVAPGACDQLVFEQPVARLDHQPSCFTVFIIHFGLSNLNLSLSICCQQLRTLRFSAASLFGDFAFWRLSSVPGPARRLFAMPTSFPEARSLRRLCRICPEHRLSFLLYMQRLCKVSSLPK